MIRLAALTYLLVTSFIPTSSDAGDCNCQIHCPNCHHVCRRLHEPTKETRQRWAVKPEVVCLPKVKFPWQKCCPEQCARVRYVNNLVREEYECERCRYRWKAELIPCNCHAATTPAIRNDKRQSRNDASPLPYLQNPAAETAPLSNSRSSRRVTALPLK